MEFRQNSLLSSIPPITKNLIIINLIVWLAQVVFLRSGTDLSDILGLHYFKSQGFRVWQPLTYMFLHDTRSFTHVFFNMFAVFMFGRILEQMWGGKKFLTYYLVTGVGAGLVQMLVYYIRIRSLQAGLDAESLQMIYTDGFDLIRRNMNYTDATAGALNMMLNTVTVGASGAVFGILLAFGMHFPNAEMFVFPIPFPIKAKWFVLGYGVIELFFGVANRTGDNVAHFAHLGGMLFGIIMILYWKKNRQNHGQYYR